MQEEDFDKELKVLVVGNGGVGKTSMIRRFCKGIFTDEYKKTIGVDFLEKSLYVDGLGQEVRFMLWDTGARPVRSASPASAPSQAPASSSAGSALIQYSTRYCWCSTERFQVAHTSAHKAHTQTLPPGDQ